MFVAATTPLLFSAAWMNASSRVVSAWDTSTSRFSDVASLGRNWNEPATAAQIRSVLAKPARLEIRGEYRTGPDVGGLDRFALTAHR